MKKQFTIQIVFLMLMLFSSKIILAQEKIDITFESKEDKIFIYYTLDANLNDEYEISVVLKRTSIPSFEYVPEDVTGDIGTGKYAGSQKTIIWQVSESEMEMFDGDDFYFEIDAVKIEDGGGIPWYVWVGGIAAGGVAAVVVLLGGDDEAESTEFAKPPARP
ncbi:MAG: hypothetical protein HND52_09815 [Ignavibacteriae bacterium]|nr:hypothetical protein [Ignavibacteriota bacterium]NOG98244.1 hypothetical protein [Ignavibacteriota bacterium]